MDETKLHIAKVEGENTSERRCRIANAITSLLYEDTQLREEVASILCLDHDPDLLDYDKQARKTPSEHGPQEELFEEC